MSIFFPICRTSTSTNRTSREDDTERSINASIEIIEAVKELSVLRGDGFDFAVRIGVATGNVTVGDLMGKGASEEANVVGKAPNLAARP